MFYAILFTLSAVAVLVILIQNRAKGWVFLGYALFVLVIFAITILASDSSFVSAYSRSTSVAFGSSSNVYPLIVGAFGAILGTIGSVFFMAKKTKVRLRSFIRPLVATPFILVPTIKLVESTDDSDLLALALLFGLSYQNGFFWQRVIDDKANE